MMIEMYSDIERRTVEGIFNLKQLRTRYNEGSILSRDH